MRIFCEQKPNSDYHSTTPRILTFSLWNGQKRIAIAVARRRHIVSKLQRARLAERSPFPLADKRNIDTPSYFFWVHPSLPSRSSGEAQAKQGAHLDFGGS